MKERARERERERERGRAPFAENLPGRSPLDGDGEQAVAEVEARQRRVRDERAHERRGLVKPELVPRQIQRLQRKPGLPQRLAERRRE